MIRKMKGLYNDGNGMPIRAISQNAIQAGYKVLFRTALDLLKDLELAEMKSELKKPINQLSKFDVLINDELGDPHYSSFKHLYAGRKKL